MRNSVLIVTLLCLGVVSFGFLSSSTLKSSGPPSCNAGEPPNFTNCSNCHFGQPVNSGTAQLMLDLGEAAGGYEPGKTYDIRVSLMKADLEAAGFQIIGLQDNDITKTPGTITLTQPTRTQVIDKNNPHPGGCAIADKVWVEHTYDGTTPDSAGRNSWKFQWTAPATDVGDVTFYLASIEADHDLTEEGDLVYTLKKTIGNKTVGVGQVAVPQFRMYPNPAYSELFLSAPERILEIQVFGTDGRMVALYRANDLWLQGEPFSISVENLKNGLYLVRTIQEQGSSVQKLRIAR